MPTTPARFRPQVTAVVDWCVAQSDGGYLLCAGGRVFTARLSGPLPQGALVKVTPPAEPGAPARADGQGRWRHRIPTLDERTAADGRRHAAQARKIARARQQARVRQSQEPAHAAE